MIDLFFRFLCWLGIHKWSKAYYVDYGTLPRRHCTRCKIQQVMIIDNWKYVTKIEFEKGKKRK